jgi:hypothetical protein
MGVGKLGPHPAFARLLPALGIAAFCLFFQPASAASFDCAKARTAIEKQICADADVSRQDGLLQETYQKLLKESAEPEKLKAEQRAWIKERDRCAGKEPDKTICLSLAYYARRGTIETELFLKQHGADESATESARYPDMWLMRAQFPFAPNNGHIAIYKLSKGVQIQLGLRGAIDDYFYVDFLPYRKNSEHLLRGFFTGQSISIKPTDLRERLYARNGVVLDSSRAMSPLPIDEQFEGGDFRLALPDGTFLQLKSYGQWNDKSGRVDPCERATEAWERVDATGQILWSRNYIIDAGPIWSQLCRTAGSPLQPAWLYERTLRQFSSHWDDAPRISDVYSLGDGTVLVVTITHLMRIRLSDGLLGRTGERMAIVDSNDMVAFKQSFKKTYPKRNADASKKYRDCLERWQSRSSEAFKRVLLTKCKVADSDPYKDYGLWNVPLNYEIEEHFLNTSAERSVRRSSE